MFVCELIHEKTKQTGWFISGKDIKRCVVRRTRNFFKIPKAPWGFVGPERYPDESKWGDFYNTQEERIENGPSKLFITSLAQKLKNT